MTVPLQFNVPFDPALGRIFVRVLYGNQRAGAYQIYVVDPSAQTVIEKLDPVTVGSAAPSPLAIPYTIADPRGHYFGFKCAVQAVQTDPIGPWSITCDVFQQDAADPQQLRHRATTNGLEGVLKDGVAAKYFFLRFA